MKVRQAIEYGVNKVAVQKAVGGPAVAKIINTAIPPGNVGYEPYNMYPDNNGQGDTAKCKSTLAAAGYPKGCLADLPVPERQRQLADLRSDPGQPQAMRREPGRQARAGLELLRRPRQRPGQQQAGHLGHGSAGLDPDWFGPNGRTIMDPLFQTSCVVNTNNYGCLQHPALDKAIMTAEAAPLSQSAGAMGQGGPDRHEGRRDRAAGSAQLLPVTRAPGCRTPARPPSCSRRTSARPTSPTSG